MFCTNCGEEITDKKFCTNCGRATFSTELKTQTLIEGTTSPSVENGSWWHRLGVVLYVFLHIPLLFVIPLVWSENSTAYVAGLGGKYQYVDTPENAFWYSLLTLLVWVFVLRVIRLSMRYIVSGRRPKWKDVLYF